MADSLRHIISKDGSSTLFSPRFDEHYHSIHGAIQESMHVFIGAGYRQKNKSEVSILEMGFGTGLNALLTLMYKGEKSIKYTALEAYPLAQDMWTQLNYSTELGEESHAIFQNLHTAEWEKFCPVSEGFELKKVQGFLQEFETEERYDLVYFDAFAPSAQPELWELEVFQKMFSLMHVEGVLVTYCAKGDVRRAMIAAGFQVKKIPGPPGKREMLRARKAS